MLGTVERTGVVAFAVFAALVPASAEALTFVQVLGLFHIAVGILLTFTLLLFATGVGVWIARFNTWPSYRETAIRVIEWAIAMLFVLIILLAIVNFFQRHTTRALTLLAFVVIVAAAIFITRMAAQSRAKPPVAGPRRPPGH